MAIPDYQADPRPLDDYRLVTTEGALSVLMHGQKNDFSDRGQAELLLSLYAEAGISNVSISDAVHPYGDRLEYVSTNGARFFSLQGSVTVPSANTDPVTGQPLPPVTVSFDSVVGQMMFKHRTRNNTNDSIPFGDKIAWKLLMDVEGTPGGVQFDWSTTAGQVK